MPLMYAGGVACFNEYRNIFKQVILYEDLVQDPIAQMTQMFELFDLPVEEVEATLKGLEKHSQNELFDKKATKTTKVYQEVMDSKVYDEIFQVLKLPIAMNMSLDEYKTFFKLK